MDTDGDLDLNAEVTDASMEVDNDKIFIDNELKNGIEISNNTNNDTNNIVEQKNITNSTSNTTTTIMDNENGGQIVTESTVETEHTTIISEIGSTGTTVEVEEPQQNGQTDQVASVGDINEGNGDEYSDGNDATANSEDGESENDGNSENDEDFLPSSEDEAETANIEETGEREGNDERVETEVTGEGESVNNNGNDNGSISEESVDRTQAAEGGLKATNEIEYIDLDETSASVGEKRKRVDIDLTEDEGRSKYRAPFAPVKKTVSCAGCTSVFMSPVAHQAHRLYWERMGQSTHIVPQKKPNQVIDLSVVPSKKQRKKEKKQAAQKIVPARTAPFINNKPQRVPSVVVQRQTLSSVTENSSFQGINIKDITQGKAPQTYVPMLPLASLTVMPITPDPSMMKLLLQSVRFVALIDLDNMSKWCSLNNACNDLFVWGFFGDILPGMPMWKNPLFNNLVDKQRLWMTRCGKGANSADFGMSYHAAQLHMLIPPSVAFFIVSSDRDHFHTMSHLLTSGRRTFVFDKRSQLQSLDGITLQLVGNATPLTILEMVKQASRELTVAPTPKSVETKIPISGASITPASPPTITPSKPSTVIVLDDL